MRAREGGGGSGVRVRAARLYAVTNGTLIVLVGDLNMDATGLKVVWSFLRGQAAWVGVLHRE